MMNALFANKAKLEEELREKVLAFCSEHDETPESVSVKMQVIREEDSNEPSIIKILILIKDSHSQKTLHEELVVA